MRFDYNAYERAFPRQEKPKKVLYDEEDIMTEKVPVEEKKDEKPVEIVEEVKDDGNGTVDESDSE